LNSSGSNPPSADKRFCEFVLVSNGLEVVGVSLGVVILSFERLATLPLSARVIADLTGKDHLPITNKSHHITETDKVKVLEEFGIIELFLKCQSGARETGDEDDCRFGRVTSSMGPDLGTVLGLHELSEGWHDEESQMLVE
jgi:hypothetical protein